MANIEITVVDYLLVVDPNVSLTPHCGASTIECQERIGLELADKIISHFNNLKNK